MSLNKSLSAIYVLWLRELKHFVRSKSRIIGSITMPLIFLLSFAGGFRGSNISGIPQGIDYLQFLVPGILAFGLMMRSTMEGISVLWDREFGFLKEILVAPIKRIHIVIGKMLGGSTVSIIQGIALVILSTLLGFRVVSIFNLFVSILVMSLIALNFVSFGLILASKMRDLQGFNLIMNILLMPLFFLSGALYPVQNLPFQVQIISYLNPLFYGVDALKYFLIGFSYISISYSLGFLVGSTLTFMFLAAYFFNKGEGV